jgi:delta 1-pyrroline-5-carboxylate dehydrogenase
MSVLATYVSFKAMSIAKADSLAAQHTLEGILSEVRSVSVRSERTERTTERIFDSQMQMVIAATMAGEQNLLRKLGSATHQVSDLLSTSLPSRFSEPERNALAEKVITRVMASIEPAHAKVVTAQVERRDRALIDLLNESENPPIAERYVQTVYQHPNMLALDSLRATEYESYLRVLDFLIDNGVFVVKDGRLDVAEAFAHQIEEHFNQGA